jgi:hypothetical protein
VASAPVTGGHFNFPVTEEALTNKVRLYSARTSWGYIALRAYAALKETSRENLEQKFPPEQVEQTLINLRESPCISSVRKSLVFDLYHRPLTKTESIFVPLPADSSHMGDTTDLIVVDGKIMGGHAAVEYYVCGPEKGLVLSINGKPAEGIRVRFEPTKDGLSKIVEYFHST